MKANASHLSQTAYLGYRKGYSVCVRTLGTAPAVMASSPDEVKDAYDPRRRDEHGANPRQHVKDLNQFAFGCEDRDHLRCRKWRA